MRSHFNAIWQFGTAHCRGARRAFGQRFRSGPLVVEKNVAGQDACWSVRRVAAHGVYGKPGGRGPSRVIGKAPMRFAEHGPAWPPG